MGLAALGILSVAVLIAIASSARAGTRQKKVVDRVAWLKLLLEKAKRGEANYSELRDGVNEAQRLGLSKLALSLSFYADLLDEKRKIKEGVTEIVKASLPGSFDSPLKGIDKSVWSKYANAQKSAKAGFISPNYHLGIYLTGMRLLEDFGYVKDTKKGDYKGRRVWLGTWVKPYTLQGFLSDAKLQYKVFAQQAKRDAKAIIKRHKKWLLGPTIEGEQASLSGLLAVAKQAGLSGLSKWLLGDRKERTTRAYKRFNRIF